MTNLWAKKRRILPLLALLLGTQACFDENDLNPDRLAGVRLTPSLAVPLVHGSLAIEDLLPEEEFEFIEYDENDLVHIVYSDTMYSTSIKELFLLPQLQLNKTFPAFVPFPSGGSQEVVVNTREELDLGFSQARFDYINLSAGRITLSGSSNVQAEVNLQLTFPTLERDGQSLVLNLTLPANTTASQSVEVNLQNYEADFTDYSTGENLLPVDIVASARTQNGTVLANPANYVHLYLDINELDFSLLTGYFGEPEINLPADEIPLTAFSNIFSQAEFRIKDPLLSLDILNSNGIPVQVETQLLQVRKESGETLALSLNPASPINIAYPATVGETAVTNLQITNAGEAFSMAPDFVEYRLTGRLNTGAVSTSNFITGESKMAVVMHADVPLYGALAGYTLSDTLDLAIEVEDAQVSEAVIRLQVSNEFPLGADIQVYFLDDQDMILETLLDETNSTLIKPSPVNEEGDNIGNSSETIEIEIDNHRFERILQSKKVVIEGTLYTTQNADGTQPDVKIKSSQRLSMNLGVRTSMNITVKP